MHPAFEDNLRIRIEKLGVILMDASDAIISNDKGIIVRISLPMVFRDAGFESYKEGMYIFKSEPRFCNSVYRGYRGKKKNRVIEPKWSRIKFSNLKKSF